MKYVFCIVVLALCAISVSQGATLFGRCKPKETENQCYVRVMKENKDNCIDISISGTFFEYRSCGSVQCGKNLRKTPVDLSKPYPDCCQKCEIIDPNLPIGLISESL
ncbi:hypothetical protein TKK_0009061 [Trichogramma kaykai]|uniref:Single domain-containing protein n=1 Tax=Trichogramma kaykai TaxID=54128 RepID=A0ABD2X3T6_9HYME